MNVFYTIYSCGHKEITRNDQNSDFCIDKMCRNCFFELKTINNNKSNNDEYKLKLYNLKLNESNIINELEQNIDCLNSELSQYLKNEMRFDIMQLVVNIINSYEKCLISKHFNLYMLYYKYNNDFNSCLLNNIKTINANRNLINFISDKENNLLTAELFRYIIYDYLNSVLDNNNMISITLLLEEININYWVRLKIVKIEERCDFLKEWGAILIKIRKNNSGLNEIIEKQILDSEENDVLSEEIEFDKTKQVYALHTYKPVYKSKKGNYKVFIEIRNLPCLECWISEKQAGNLEEAFSSINNKYSYAKNTVFAVFEKDRFIWAGVISGERNDRKFFRDKFRVDVPEFSFEQHTQPKLKIPENVEILPELIDED